MSYHKKTKRTSIFQRGINQLKKRSSKLLPNIKDRVENIGKHVSIAAKKTFPYTKKNIQDIFGINGVKRATYKHKSKNNKSKNNKSKNN